MNARQAFGVFLLVLVSCLVSPAMTFGAGAAPQATPTSAQTLQNTPVTILLGATDLDNGQLTISMVAAPLHGTVVISPTACVPLGKSIGGWCTANATYTPTTGYNGPDSFTFKANDGTLDSNIA